MGFHADLLLCVSDISQLKKTPCISTSAHIFSQSAWCIRILNRLHKPRISTHTHYAYMRFYHITGSCEDKRNWNDYSSYAREVEKRVFFNEESSLKIWCNICLKLFSQNKTFPVLCTANKYNNGQWFRGEQSGNSSRFNLRIDSRWLPIQTR